MKHSDLDSLLRSAPVPERGAEYWEDFPQSVTRRLAGDRSPAFRPPERRRRRLFLWSVGLATVCIMIGFAIGSWHGRESSLPARQVAAMRKYFLEVETLFPNQVRAIVIDKQGPRLVLAEKPELAPSTPLLLNIQSRSGSQSVITFSGQQIVVDGEVCDVLDDAQGHVLLVGEKFVWSSGRQGLRKAPYRIQAQPLEAL